VATVTGHKRGHFRIAYADGSSFSLSKKDFLTYFAKTLT
jgi:hypothetical protein